MGTCYTINQKVCCNANHDDFSRVLDDEIIEDPDILRHQFNSTKINSKTIEQTIIKSNPQSDLNHQIEFDPKFDPKPYKPKEFQSLFEEMKNQNIVSSIPLHVLIEEKLEQANKQEIKNSILDFIQKYQNLSQSDSGSKLRRSTTLKQFNELPQEIIHIRSRKKKKKKKKLKKMRTIELTENDSSDDMKEIYTCPMKQKDLDSQQDTHKTQKSQKSILKKNDSTFRRSASMKKVQINEDENELYYLPKTLRKDFAQLD